jgi:hypothetical protein
MLLFRAADGAEYRIMMDFLNSAQPVYVAYRAAVPRYPNRQEVQIGDEAFVSPENRLILAVMRYRNVLVYIEPPYRPETIRIPLTNDQLIAVLKDVYEKFLKP